ncbi:MAG TPA: divalent metal cation transporter [Terriglobales bacterium]|nr:divalent metal cation transporter [Terriglobales bacterium]
MKPPLPWSRRSRWKKIAGALGPGLVGGGADNDPAGIATFTVIGASSGFAHLWLMVITAPMETAVQTVCGVIGADSQHGLASLLRLRFGWAAGLAATLAFLAGSFLALAADVRILSDALALLTGLPGFYFPVLLAYVCWNLLVFHSFRRAINILLLLNVVFAAYIVAALAVHPPWAHVLANTLWPHWTPPGGTTEVYLANAAALVGTRFSPYMFYWQSSAETERFTEVRVRGQTELDITLGMILSNSIGYFIILTTAATLYVHGLRQVQTVTQAAAVLRPLAGEAAALLYTLGVLGAGLIAIPVLSAAASYALAETMSWRRGLEFRPWQARRFYIVLSCVLIAAAALSYLPWNTIEMAYWSQVYWGVLAAPLLVLIFFLERRRSARKIQISRGQRIWLAAATVLSVIVAAMMLGAV